jgi:hypothetical protein
VESLLKRVKSNIRRISDPFPNSRLSSLLSEPGDIYDARKEQISFRLTLLFRPIFSLSLRLMALIELNGKTVDDHGPCSTGHVLLASDRGGSVICTNGRLDPVRLVGEIPRQPGTPALMWRPRCADSTQTLSRCPLLVEFELGPLNLEMCSPDTTGKDSMCS